MPNTVSAIATATPNERRITFRVIDSRGDKRAFGFPLPAAAVISDANLNALLDAYGDATNANLYAVEITNIYATLPLASGAVDAVFTSADDVVGVLFKPTVPGSSNPDIRLEVRAPIGDMVLVGETVDVTDPTYIAVRDAFDALIGGLFGIAYAPISARFTERRNKNSAVPAE